MKKKIHFGKKTLISIEFQITTILTSLNRLEVRIDKIQPVRHNTGNFVIVSYHTIAEPEVARCQYFAHQKIGDFCDLWLENPTDQHRTGSPRTEHLTRPSPEPAGAIKSHCCRS